MITKFYSRKEIQVAAGKDPRTIYRWLCQELMNSAKETADMANANLRAARTNFKLSEEALAALLPNSKCIHDELQIAVP